MQISTILDSIEQESFALPEFQRGYVWGRDQVRQLFHSMYQRFPVGSLLVWETKANVTAARGSSNESWQVVKLILDGQQRITSLYGVMRGHPPTFFQGNASAFENLYFNVESQTFEFYGPVKMKDDPLWINVTALYKTGVIEAADGLHSADGLSAERRNVYLERMLRVHSIRDTDLHVESITGPAFDVDTVVEIFNRVNSGGTKLSKGDLALAKICAEWPPARKVMSEHLERWQESGYTFRLDWLLRNVNAILTGEALFSALKDTDSDTFRDGLDRAVSAVDKLLMLVASRLGLDHSQVLGGTYAFPVMARYLDQNKGKLVVEDENKLLFWYVNAAIWGRHSGSTETMLNTDLRAIEEGGLDQLIHVLELWRGDLTVRPEHFAVAERGSRFYMLLYLLTRVGGARDFGSGIPLSKHLLGKLSKLELHHIFPNAMLRDLGFDRRDRNALANFCFLTQETNLAISMKPPTAYMGPYEQAHPGVLGSQWIPEDESLREPDRYNDFLAERRKLLASAANTLLASLRTGTSAPVEAAPQVATGLGAPVVIGGEEDEAETLGLVLELVRECGLAEPEIPFEELDEHGDVLYEANAGWPAGLRSGLSDPCAFLIEPDAEMEARLSEFGVRFFTEFDAFRQYVETLVGEDLDGDGVVGFHDVEDDEEGTSEPEERDESGGTQSDPSSLEQIELLIRSDSPPAQAQYRLAYLRRCVEDLGLVTRRPKRKRGGYYRYFNLRPAAPRSAPRVASLRPSSGRLGVYVDPEAALGFTNAEVVTNHGRPVYVRVYLTSHSAVNDAVALTAKALGVPVRGAATSPEPIQSTFAAAAGSDDAQRFHQALLAAVAECKRIGYNPSYFVQMLSEHGGVETARRLIVASTVSEGFSKLWELGRLELSVEAVALRPEFSALFPASELEIARERLRSFGFGTF